MLAKVGLVGAEEGEERRVVEGGKSEKEKGKDEGKRKRKKKKEMVQVYLGLKISSLFLFRNFEISFCFYANWFVFPIFVNFDPRSTLKFIFKIYKLPSKI